MKPLSETRLKETEDFIAVQGKLPANGLFASHRQAALAALRTIGVPQRRDEYWRFFNPALMFTMGTSRHAFLPFDFASAPATGLTRESLADVDACDIHWASALFGRLADRAQSKVARPYVLAGTAFSAKGDVLHLAAGGQAVLVRDLTGEGRGGFSHDLIRLEAGSSLRLIDINPPAHGMVQTIEAEVGEGANFHHIRLQDGCSAGLVQLLAEVGTGGRCRSFSLGAGGQGLRNETVLWLAGRGATCHTGGAWIGAGEATCHDDTIFITHEAPACESRQVYRSVLGRGALVAFQGKILVQQVAQKTDGYQLSQALLLEEDAQFLAKPELEIYADDVKCSHGSTTGSLNPDELFYLRARGIPMAEARRLLVLAFLHETLSEIEDEGLAGQLAARIDTLAEQELS